MQQPTRKFEFHVNRVDENSVPIEVHALLPARSASKQDVESLLATYALGRLQPERVQRGTLKASCAGGLQVVDDVEPGERVEGAAPDEHEGGDGVVAIMDLAQHGPAVREVFDHGHQRSRHGAGWWDACPA
jgi:hypothetical protein